MVVAPLSAAAQPQGSRPARIGFLWTASRTAVSPYRDAFIEGLRQLGHAEGRDVTIEHRYAEDRLDALAGLAAELLRVGAEVVVTQGTPAARAAKQATATVPIVMINVGDPVRAGLIASLPRPGGNVTGLTLVAPEMTVKRLELLKETLPKVARVAVLWDSASTGFDADGTLTAAARSLGLRLQRVEVRAPKDLEGALAEARRNRAEALLVLPSPILNYQRARLVELAAKEKLPASYQSSEFVEAGGLMSYGPDLPDIARRAATYVDKILKGAKPADLPVEQPVKFELVVNMKTAKALGLTIPPAILTRADEVIP
jgi:putative ABC transport system substrate-binding protein